MCAVMSRYEPCCIRQRALAQSMLTMQGCCDATICAVQDAQVFSALHGTSKAGRFLHIIDFAQCYADLQPQARLRWFFVITESRRLVHALLGSHSLLGSSNLHIPCSILWMLACSVWDQLACAHTCFTTPGPTHLRCHPPLWRE